MSDSHGMAASRMYPSPVGNGLTAISSGFCLFVLNHCQNGCPLVIAALMITCRSRKRSGPGVFRSLGPTKISTPSPFHTLLFVKLFFIGVGSLTWAVTYKFCSSQAN
ncbi:hypothetical protein D3C73_975090 [compost metagenome]